MAASIRGARIVTLQGGKHFLFRDSPETALREIDGFL
jgi:pimeloyl-ACP methyl ester carboxylesterase